MYIPGTGTFTLMGPNGIGKSTQAATLKEILDSEGHHARHIETKDLIKVMLPSRSDLEVDVLSDGTEIDLVEEERRYRTGQFTTPAWVAELLRREMTDALSKKETCIFSGSPRTIEEGWGFHEMIRRFQITQQLGSLYVVRLRFPRDDKSSQQLGYDREDFSIARTRILTGATVEDEDDRYKVEQFDLRLTWYLEHTLPTIRFLEGTPYIKREFVEIIDDGTRTPEAIHEEIVEKLERVIRGEP